MPYKDPVVRAAKSREYAKKDYWKNHEKRKAEGVARSRARREWFNEYKESHPCDDCGQFYPACVMDFDHRDPDEKVQGLATMVTYSWAKILAEIAKCDLVCANCHRIRTHRG